MSNSVNLSRNFTVRTSHEVLTFRDTEVQLHRRAFKRSIGITLQVNGRIRVTAPKTAPVSKIREFLLANTEWIEANLRRYESLRQMYPPKRFFEGEKFIYMGRELTLKYAQSIRLKPMVYATDDTLMIEVPSSLWTEFNPRAPHPALSDIVTSFYEKSGRKVLGSRLEYYSERMGLRPSSVRFGSQKTRWGSCSSRGRISLNWRLIIAPLEVIDYVVIHELSHLIHYNHSKAFWDLVATQSPNYFTLRDWLSKNQYEADFLAKRSELHS